MPMSGSLTEDPVARRVRAVVAAAAWHGTTVSLTDLAGLLPEGGPQTAGDVRGWLLEHPGSAELHGDRLSAPGHPAPGTADALRREARAGEYLQAAQSLLDRTLGFSRRMTECVGVTGSTAYASPLEGDDLDFMVVTPPGTCWLYLFSVLLALRLRGARAPEGAEWCFNYVTDGPTARRAFAEPQGFLFAREALTARILVGEPEYVALLRGSTWMRDELPRLYASRVGGSPTGRPPRAPAPGPMWGVANALLFPAVAAYLRLKALRRNARYRREGRWEELFEVETRPGRYALYSRKFQRLRELCGAPASASPVDTDGWRMGRSRAERS